MKVLVVCDEYAYRLGEQFYLREFGHILVQRYLNVFEEIRFAVRTKEVNNLEELKNFNQPIRDKRIEVFPVPFFQGPREYATNYFKVKKVLKKAADNCPFCILRLPSTVGFEVLKTIYKKKIPYALELVANEKQNAQETSNQLHRFLVSTQHKRQLKACQNALGIAYVTKDFLQRDYPKGAETKFVTNYSSVELQHSFFIGPKTFPGTKSFSLCHIAHPINSPRKGHFEVLKVVKRLEKIGKDVRVKFAGDGSLVKDLINYSEKLGVRNKVEFVGILNKKQILNLLRSSDLMIFPSKTEGLPRVLIEAMAAGLPFVSTKAGGIPELIDDSFLFDPENVDGFAKKILELMEDKEIYEQTSLKIFEKAMNYSEEALTNKRNRFFKSLKNYV